MNANLGISGPLFAVVLFATPATAAAADLNTGDHCQLTNSVSLMEKDGGGERLARLNAGVQVEILKASTDWTWIAADGQRGYVKSAWFNQVCERLASQPTGSSAVDEVTATEAGTEAITAAAPGSTPPPQPDPDDPGFGTTYKIKIAVMDLKGTGLPPELLTALSSTVPETIDALGPFKAISSQDIIQMLHYEAQQQVLGCTDEACWAQIGGTLGADFLVNGTITRVDEIAMVQLQLLNTMNTKVENRISREHQGPTSELFDTMRSAARALMQPILGQHSGELMVKVTEEGASISVNGTIVGVSPLGAPLTLAGGTHTIGVNKQGFIRFLQDVMVTDAGQATVEAQLMPSTEFIRTYQSNAGTMRTLAWVSIAAGAAALGTGVSLLVVGSEQAKAYNEQVLTYNARTDRDSGQYNSLGQWEKEIAAIDSAVLPTLIFGVAGLTTGILLWILGDDPYRYETMLRTEADSEAASKADSVVDAQLLILPGGAGLAVTF